MPRRQKPNVERRSDGWYFRLRAPEGFPGPSRPRFGPFKSEREAERAGWAKLDEFEAWDPDAPTFRETPTVAVLVEEFLSVYTDVEANTRRATTDRLRYALRAVGDGGLGDLAADRLDYLTIKRWRSKLPAGSAHPALKALRQLLRHGVKTYPQLASALEAATEVENPEPKRREIRPFETLDEIESIADELPDRYRAVPLFAALSGLRPEEWIPLRRRDLDLDAAEVHVRRVYTDGEIKPARERGKGMRRTVPLPDEAVSLMRAWPIPLDLDGLIFPAARGGLIDLHAWRGKHWNPAVHAAGLAVCECGHRSGDHGIERRDRGCKLAGCGCAKFVRAKGSPTPYALRHTYAAYMLGALVPTDTLARFMGTSVSQIEATYGHLLPNSADLVRRRANEYLRELRAATATRKAASEQT